VDLVDAAGVEQDALRQRRLAAVDVRGDADVAQLEQRLQGHNRSKLKREHGTGGQASCNQRCAATRTLSSSATTCAAAAACAESRRVDGSQNGEAQASRAPAGCRRASGAARRAAARSALCSDAMISAARKEQFSFAA
jgi:hypothetical protein